MKRFLTAVLALSIAVCSLSQAFAAPAKKTINLPAAKGTNYLTGHAQLPADGSETDATLLVSPQWLRDNLGKVVIIDCRFDTLYHSGHIPGAVSAPWTYFVDTTVPVGGEKYGTILPVAQLAKKMAALGINRDRIIVCYSDIGDWGQGGWAVALLRAAGIANAKVLDGGIYAWKQYKYPMTTKPSVNAAPVFSIKQLDRNYFIETPEVKTLLGQPGVAVVDVRTPAEYEGKIAPFKEKRKGHLPGALSIPTDEFLTKDGFFKTSADIAAMLEAKGITKDMIVILYDTCGVRAGFATMACRLAGYGKACFYDNGFQAWAGNPELPLE